MLFRSDRMTRVLRRLQDVRFVEFRELFDEEGAGVPEVVVTLLAILELARESLIDISQQEPYSPIYVKLNSIQMEAA